MPGRLTTESDFGALLQEGRTARRLPGLAVTLIDGERSETHCVGHFDEESGRAVDRETLFALGCVAKVVTAVLIMRLCERGELELDALVVDCLDRNSPLRARIRSTTAIGHLLSHTSGIYGPLDYQSSSGKALEFDEPFEGEVHQSSEPGSIYAYSHTGYACAAFVLETITRKTWLSMARELFEEIGGQLVAEPGEHAPRGHEWCGPDRPARALRRPDRSRRPDVWMAAIGDGLYSNSTSLASLGLALLTRDELPRAKPLLTDRSLNLLRHADWRPKYGGSPFFGLGLKQFARGCYGHRGWAHGQISFLLICPELRGVLAFLTNINNDALARRSMLHLTGRDFDLQLWVGRQDAALEPTTCIGRYALGDHFVDIASRGSKLTFCARSNDSPSASSPSPVTLFPVAPNLFAAPCPFTCLPGGWTSMMIEFLRDNEGSDCRWMRVNDLVYERLAEGNERVSLNVASNLSSS